MAAGNQGKDGRDKWPPQKAHISGSWCSMFSTSSQDNGLASLASLHHPASFLYAFIVGSLREVERASVRSNWKMWDMHLDLQGLCHSNTFGNRCQGYQSQLWNTPPRRVHSIHPCLLPPCPRIQCSCFPLHSPSQSQYLYLGISLALVPMSVGPRNSPSMLYGFIWLLWILVAACVSSHVHYSLWNLSVAAGRIYSCGT